MKTIKTKLAALAIVLAGLCAASPALAGKGGNASKIRSAVASRSVDAIVAEVERAEGLICDECIQVVTDLTEDERYAVREVAAWWFAKRPATARLLADGFIVELESGGSVAVRNAADFLGATITYRSLPALRTAITRTDLGTDARLALVRAVKVMGHRDGNFVLLTAMGDPDATVRAAAINAWRDIRGQLSASPVVAALADPDATVRAEAATVVGAMRDVTARAMLETLVATDASPFVRRNAAWALGRLGQGASRDVLAKATTDTSGLVRLTAKASLAQLR
ncbi:MAG: HEAT repeat domain-containing protein [Deltaproteobacteria bacterium]|nr:HEAT repeat domain-containing protein [Deltaproteobacteria bacterium]MDQ3295882.1 HEAT repeat domain-containing protein [Myxococcota bacterium]